MLTELYKRLAMEGFRLELRPLRWDKENDEYIDCPIDEAEAVAAAYTTEVGYLSTIPLAEAENQRYLDTVKSMGKNAIEGVMNGV